MTEPHDVAVVGGGQAGLSLGYHLRRRGLSLVIFEANERLGDVWRRRWDSLRLFSPAQYSGLPGLAFPAPPDTYPTKDEVADYHERYRAEFDLPVQLGSRVQRVAVSGSGYTVEVNGEISPARNVVVATGPFQVPSVPPFAADLHPEVFQVHSADYRNPDRLPPGPVLVVGALASGCQIAEELLAAGRSVDLAVGSTQTVTPPQRLLGKDIFWWGDKARFFEINVDSRLGRYLSHQPNLAPDASIRRVRRRGGRLRPRAVRATGDLVGFADGSETPVHNVVWATGFRSDYSFVDVDVFDDGEPRHHRGVTDRPGLYFLGRRWLYSAGSTLVGWVGRDAEFIADHIAERRRATPA